MIDKDLLYLMRIVQDYSSGIDQFQFFVFHEEYVYGGRLLVAD